MLFHILDDHNDALTRKTVVYHQSQLFGQSEKWERLVVGEGLTATGRLVIRRLVVGDRDGRDHVCIHCEGGMSKVKSWRNCFYSVVGAGSWAVSRSYLLLLDRPALARALLGKQVHGAPYLFN